MRRISGRADRLTLQGGVRYDHCLTTYPDSEVGGPGYPFAPQEMFYPARSTAGIQLERHHAADGRGLRPVRERQDGRQVQPGQVHAGRHGDQQRPGPEPADSHDRQHDAVVDRHQQGLRAGLRSQQPRQERRMRRHGQSELRDRRCSRGRSTRTSSPAGASGPYNWGLGIIGPAGSRAPRLGERRLLPALVRQLVRRRQPGDESRRTTRRSASRRRSIRGCRTAAATRSAVCTTSCRTSSDRSTSSRSASSNFGKQTENWQGVDVNVIARLRNGLTVQGGTSTGRRLSDACALKAAVPEQGQGPTGTRQHLDCRRLGGQPVLPRRRAVFDASSRGSRRTRSRKWTFR